MVRNGTERAVSRKLEAIPGIRPYCPVYQHYRRLPKHQRSKEGSSRKRVEAPLFPGYIFMLLRDESATANLKSDRDVIGFVRNEAGLCYAPDDQIRKIMDLESQGQYNDSCTKSLKEEANRLFLLDLVGKQVRLIDGPLRGFKGQVTQSDGYHIGIDLGSKPSASVVNVHDAQGKVEIVKDDRDPDHR